jgi:hypothetical protein
MLARELALWTMRPIRSATTTNTKRVSMTTRARPSGATMGCALLRDTTTDLRDPNDSDPYLTCLAKATPD